MVRPLCFDAEALASYVGAHDGSRTKLAGDWAFLATDEQDVVHLVDDEGARPTGLQLDAFTVTLRPSSP